MNPSTHLKKPVWLVLFVGTFLFVLLATNRLISVYDEGLILVGAERVANGAFPHRDFYANYGPAQFFILASLFKTFGTSILVERLWDAFMRTTVSLLVAHIALRFVSRTRAFLAALACLAFLVQVGVSGYPVFPALVFVLVSVVCLLSWFDGNQSHFRLALAGVAIGIVTLFRYEVGFFSFMVEAAVLGAFMQCHCGESRDWRKTGLAIMSYGGGTAVILAPAAVLYWVAGIVRDFWFDLVYFQFHFYARMRSQPFPIPHFSTFLYDPDKLLNLIIYFLPFAWITAGFHLLSSNRSDLASANPDLQTAKVQGNKVWPIILLGALSIVFSLKGLVGVSAIAMVLALIPAVLVFSIAGGGPAGEKKRYLPITVGTAIFTVILLMSAGVGMGARMKQNISWLIRGESWTRSSEVPRTGICSAPQGLERMSCFTLDVDRIAAIQYVQKNTRPNDAIFVGLGRHDKIYVNDMAFYFVAQRRPATKWYHFDPGLQTSEKIQREMIQELETAKPRYVVLETEWDDVKEPNDSATSSGVLILDDYIRLRYRTEATFKTIKVAALIPQGGRPRDFDR